MISLFVKKKKDYYTDREAMAYGLFDLTIILYLNI